MSSDAAMRVDGILQVLLQLHRRGLNVFRDVNCSLNAQEPSREEPAFSDHHRHDGVDGLEGFDALGERVSVPRRRRPTRSR
jgi:hypothetical protein